MGTLLEEKVNLIIERIKKNGLPGEEAQLEMTPPLRPRVVHDKEKYIDSAVIILLQVKNNKICFPLIRRTSNNKKDRHKGQIGLPGGKLDTKDKSFKHCAIRELEEELGVNPNDIQEVCNLTELYIPISHFKVQPFVFFTEKEINFKIQPNEVEYYFEVSIDDLLDDKIIRKTSVRAGNGKILHDIPYFYLDNHIVWGATAMILSELKSLLK